MANLELAYFYFQIDFFLQIHKKQYIEISGE